MLDKSIHSFLQALFLLLSLEFMQPRLQLVLAQVLVKELVIVLVKVQRYREVLQDLMTIQTMRRLAIVKSHSLHSLLRVQHQNLRIRNLKLSSWSC